MSNAQQAGAVLYAKNVDRLVQFYALVAGLGIGRTAKDHAVLECQSFQLVVVQIPKHIADPIDITEPPMRREQTPIKLVFPIESIANARDVVPALGGSLNAMEHEWEFEGHRVCDGHDPEGNVFQLRAPLGKTGLSFTLRSRS